MLVLLLAFVGVQVTDGISRRTLDRAKLVAQLAVIGNAMDIIGHLCRKNDTLVYTCRNLPAELDSRCLVGRLDLAQYRNILSYIDLDRCLQTEVMDIVSDNRISVLTVYGILVNCLLCRTRCRSCDGLHDTFSTADDDLREVREGRAVDSLGRCIELQRSLQCSRRIGSSRQVVHHGRCLCFGSDFHRERVDGESELISLGNGMETDVVVSVRSRFYPFGKFLVLDTCNIRCRKDFLLHCFNGLVITPLHLQTLREHAQPSRSLERYIIGLALLHLNRR